MKAEVRVGISGWRYEPWRGVFYPTDLVQAKELHFASRELRSIELNGSFYSLQKPSSYLNWYSETPADFVFSVKGPRFITHMRRLGDVRSPLGNFFASGVLHLREKLGPLLWQLPPNLGFEPKRLESFCQLLPKNFKQAIQLTRSADRVDPDTPKGHGERRIRHALEVRSHSFENPEFIDILRRYGVALVFADTAGKWPYFEDLTSDFVYVRLHGEKEIYSGSYSDAALKVWADRIRHWRRGSQVANPITLTDEPLDGRAKPVFVYFDNDRKTCAPGDAKRLQKKLER